MPFPEALQGDTWSVRIARKILPLLVWCAKNEKTITYADLDREVVRRKWGRHAMVVGYGHPAGATGNAMIETSGSWDIDIPPLNSLIVNAKTGVPGDGCDWYLRNFCRVRGRLSAVNRKALAEATHQKVWNFRRWDRILREYGLIPLDSRPRAQKQEDVPAPRRSGWSSEGESKEHKRLTRLIAHNPKVLGLDRKLPKGFCNPPLASGDRPDVLFRPKGELIAVEVKSSISNDADLQRGIYQCVKYRAILRAEQQAQRKLPNGWALLATTRPLPTALASLARMFNVDVVVLPDGSA